VKPPPFEYCRPHSLAEALGLLAEHGAEAKPLAGGQSLIPLLSMRLAQPALLVDLERVPELRSWARSGPSLRIGATTRQVELERADAVPGLIKEAVRHIGHFQIRNRSTVGGSIAHADPAAEWPALAVAFDAQLVVSSAVRGSRQIRAHDFFLGPLTTTLAPDELIVEIVIPNTEGRGGFAEAERRSGDFALVGAVAQRGRIVVFGAGSRPQRLEETERLAIETRTTEGELAAAAEAEIEAFDDIHASRAYRKRVGGRLVAEVTRRASV
jgi:aerobic carbon-monoxide dehydrogenase medium subunit